MSYEIITVRGGRPPGSHECYPHFLRSLDRHSCRPIFLPGPWNGMTSKLKNLWAYLMRGDHTGKQLIFSDCYDVVIGNPLLKHPNDWWPTLMERFKSFGVPFVCNAEKNIFPFPERREAFEKFVPADCQSPFKFLNSGFYIAETDALVEILRFIDPPSLLDDHVDSQGQQRSPADQERLQEAFLAQVVPMKLDYDGLICTATHDVSERELTNFVQATTWGNRLLLHHGKCDCLGPMTWHFNGAKNRQVMNTVFRALNL